MVSEQRTPVRASRAKRVTAALADATGRTDEELDRAAIVAVLAAAAAEALILTLRLLNRLDELGGPAHLHRGRHA